MKTPMKACTLQNSTGHRDCTLRLLEEMLTTTDRKKNSPIKIFLNERGKEEGALLALPTPSSAPPGSAVAHRCEEMRVSIRSQP